MSNKILSSVAIVAILGASSFLIYHKFFRAQPHKMDKVEQEISNDRDLLKRFMDNKDVSEGNLYAAVIRLSQEGEKMALKAAEQLVNNESKLLREGAAQALGYFDDSDILPLVEVLFNDKEESVRVFAIESLGESSSPKRLNKIEELAKKKSLGPSETVAVKAALYRLRTTPQEKERELTQLVGLTKNTNTELSKKAALRAIQLAGDSKVVAPVMREAVRNGGDDTVKSLSIRTLANMRDPMIAEKLPDLIKDKSKNVRVAAVQTIHRVCPSNRWAILAQVVKKDQDEFVVSRALEEMSFLERAKAHETLTQLAIDRELTPAKVQMVQLMKSEIDKKPEVKVCH